MLATRSKLQHCLESFYISQATDYDASSFTKFSETTLSNRAIASRDINPGEEITISCMATATNYTEL
jgi:hypothetical protein